MTERRRNPAIHDYCRSCMGWGSTTVRKGSEYEDEWDCLDCGGTGIRNNERSRT